MCLFTHCCAGHSGVGMSSFSWSEQIHVGTKIVSSYSNDSALLIAIHTRSSAIAK